MVPVTVQVYEGEVMTVLTVIFGFQLLIIYMKYLMRAMTKKVMFMLNLDNNAPFSLQKFLTE